jgi:hypothetical protein
MLSRPHQDNQPLRLGHDWPPHLRRRDAEVFADLLGEPVVDLGGSGNAGGSTGGADEDGMIATLAEQPAAVLLQMVDQRAPFHALIFRGSRMIGPGPVACWASSRLASRIMATASCRFAMTL